MPIDLRRLKSERSLYEKSLRLRGGDDEEAQAQTADVGKIDLALALLASTHAISKDRDGCKSQVRNKNDGVDMKNHLKQLDTKLASAQASLREALYCLPNWVDGEVLASEEFTTTANDEFDSPTTITEAKVEGYSANIQPDIPDDPMFCIGGYDEVLVAGGACCVLTGVGSQLGSSLQQHFTKALLQDSKFAAATCWDLAHSMERIPLCQYRKLWGCPNGRIITTEQQPPTMNAAEDQQEQHQNVQIPSWMTLLGSNRQHGGFYFDRQLPKIHILRYSASPLPDLDDREVARRATWSNNNSNNSKKKHKRPWHQRVGVNQQIQLLAITGPLLAADSRPLQRAIAETVQSIFQELVGEATAVRIRALPAAELLPAEASRLVVEGFLPYGGRRGRGPNRKPVCLAYISNVLNYCSGSEIRHGTTKEDLHVLHGTVCSAAETLEWMCQNRAEPLSSRVTLPRVLVDGGGATRTVPYQRRHGVKKNGKKTVQELIAVEKAGDDDDWADHAPPKPFGPLGQGERPTPDQIRAEALSAPSFLPFYY